MFLRIAVVSLIALTSSPAFAGWASGGGRLTKFSNNPWWLENTRTVDYCIVVDEETFGVSKTVIQSIVAESLSMWKTALAAAPNTPAAGSALPSAVTADSSNGATSTQSTSSMDRWKLP